MCLSHISRRLSTAGEMVNLMAVDAQKVMQLVQSFNQIWSAPFQICVAIYFLYVTMGVATLAGVGVLLLLVPLNLLLARLVRNIQVNHFKHCRPLHVSNHTRVKHNTIRILVWAYPYMKALPQVFTDPFTGDHFKHWVKLINLFSEKFFQILLLVSWVSC